MGVRKPRIILGQLGETISSANLPLAAGYLKSMAYAASLLKVVDIEILNRKLSYFATDAQLISYIVEKQPICVGFTCYLWNVERTSYVINQIKRYLPKTKIILGGGEASSQSMKLMKENNIDIIVQGEGELVFVQLIKNLLFNRPKLEEIKGIVFRSKSKLVITPQQEPIEDLDTIPSPYLLGFIDIRQYTTMILQTYRGCVNRCAYCNFRNNTAAIRFFSVKRVEDELMLVRKYKTDFQILDSNFILPRNILRLAEMIKRINYDKYFTFFVQAQAEHVSKKIARLLSDCNITDLEIGLQSSNPVALANVRRWFDKRKFVQGLKILKKAKIKYFLDLIIGLPGDTESSILKSVRFAKRYAASGAVTCNMLYVLPDTDLARDAKRFQLKYLHKPPYPVLSTKELSWVKLKKICRKTPVEWGEGNVYGLPSRNIGWFFYFSKDDYIKLSEVAPDFDYSTDSIPYFVFEANCNNQSVEQLKQICVHLRKSLFLNSQIYIRCTNLNQNFRIIQEFLYQITDENPFCQFRIFLESDDVVNVSILNQLQKAIVHRFSFPERRHDYFSRLLDDRPMLRNSIQLLRTFSINDITHSKMIRKYNDVFWKVLVSRESHWKTSIRDVVRLNNGHALIQFAGDELDLPLVDEVLKYRLKVKQEDNACIYFSDYAVQILCSSGILKRPLAEAERRTQEMLCNKNQYMCVYIDKYLNRSIWKYNATRCAAKVNALLNYYKRR